MPRGWAAWAVVATMRDGRPAYDAAVSPARTEWPVVAGTEAWRPMAFGAKNASRIKNPICEPLWGGARVLVEVSDGAVRIRDVDGERVPGFNELEAAIAGAATASELVLDGYMLPAPLRDLIDDAILAGVGDTPTSGQMARQMMLGGLGRNRRQEQLEDANARRVELAPSEPAAFVATDLLWLDGQALIDIPLGERKRLLDSVLTDVELVRRTVTVRLPIEPWYRQWRAFGFREFAVKDANSRYIPGGASDQWTTAPIPKR